MLDYAPGVGSMKSERNSDEIYRAAFESANADLTEISAEFERLSARKDRIEKLLVALQPFVALKEEQAVNVASVLDKPTQRSEAAQPPVESKRELEPNSADPFQRRIDHVLGIGAGIRDVRKYTRQF